MTTPTRILAALPLLLILIHCRGSAQPDPPDVVSSFPFAGSSDEIRELLADGNDAELSLIFLIYPRTFVRGELLVGQIARRIRESGWEGKVLGIARMNRYYGAIRYAQEFRFPFPLIIDTAGDVFHTLGLSESAPWVTVWNREGELLYAKSTFVGNNDSAVVGDILRVNKGGGRGDILDDPSGGSSCLVRIHDPATLERLVKPVVRLRSAPLKDDSTTMLGSLQWLALGSDGRYASAVNRDLLVRYVFDLQSGELLGELRPSDSTLHSFTPSLLPSTSHSGAAFCNRPAPRC